MAAMRNPSLIIPACLALAVSGCMAAENISTRTTGGPYPQAAASRLAFSDDQDPVRAVIGEALAARGPQIVEDAPVLIEAMLTERPEGAGAFVGERPAPEDEWLTAPVQTPWWRRPARVRTLTVRLVDADTGQELRRAEAAYRIRPGQESKAPPPAELAREAVDALLVTPPTEPPED